MHGFSGSPLEMMPLGEVLSNAGWTVANAQLAGHGTSPKDLARTSWREWIASAADAYEDLRRRTRRQAIIGLSMGGAIALYLAAREGADAVVAISTPIRVRPMLAGAARVASRIIPLAPVIFRLSPRDPMARQYRSPYAQIPLGATAELSALLSETMRLLPSLTAPVLVVQGRRDWVIPKDSGEAILARAARAPGRLLWLRRSGHMATLDRDREMLFEEVKGFLRDHLVGESPVDGTANRA
ncbi:MAG: alpha/beta hydrolase [Candidatus Limnocylindria bacterium]